MELLYRVDRGRHPRRERVVGGPAALLDLALEPAPVECTDGNFSHVLGIDGESGNLGDPPGGVQSDTEPTPRLRGYAARVGLWQKWDVEGGFKYSPVSG